MIADSTQTNNMDDLIEVPEKYIEQHQAVCSRQTPKKWKVSAPPGEHKGKGGYRTRNVKQRQRECAKRLYRKCIKLGIEPVLRWAEYFEQYQKVKP